MQISFNMNQEASHCRVKPWMWSYCVLNEKQSPCHSLQDTEWYLPAYSPTLFSIALLHSCFPPAMLIFLLVLKHTKLLPSAWLLKFLFTLPGVHFSQTFTQGLPNSTSSQIFSLTPLPRFQIRHVLLDSYFLNWPITISTISSYCHNYLKLLTFLCIYSCAPFPFISHSQENTWTCFLLKGKHYVLFIGVCPAPVTEQIVNNN